VKSWSRHSKSIATGRRNADHPEGLALDIGTDPVEANFLVGSLIYATIRGLPPPPGTVAITNKRVRGKLVIFWLKTRMGWREEHRGKPGYRKFYRPYP